MKTHECAWWFNFVSAVALAFVIVALAFCVSGCKEDLVCLMSIP